MRKIAWCPHIDETVSVVCTVGFPVGNKLLRNLGYRKSRAFYNKAAYKMHFVKSAFRRRKLFLRVLQILAETQLSEYVPAQIVNAYSSVTSLYRLQSLHTFNCFQSAVTNNLKIFCSDKGAGPNTPEKTAQQRVSTDGRSPNPDTIDSSNIIVRAPTNG